MTANEGNECSHPAARQLRQMHDKSAVYLTSVEITLIKNFNSDAFLGQIASGENENIQHIYEIN